MTYAPSTFAMIDAIVAFENWDYDRQTTAIERTRALCDQFPDSADTLTRMADILARMRDKAHPDKARSAA